MPSTDAPVLIVGGGPVDLSASLLLSRHGVRSLLVERHLGTSVHPKARGLNVRTLELFRVWGLEPAVRAAASALDRAVDVVWAPTLVAPETRRVPYGGAGERLQADSPTTSAGCAQDTLELVLLAAARSYELDGLRFGQELTALSQDSDGVSATIVDRTSGEEAAVRAAWVIAADGAQSTIRSMLDIGMVGPGALFHRMGIYFRADLRETGASRPALLYLVTPPEGSGGRGAFPRWSSVPGWRCRPSHSAGRWPGDERRYPGRPQPGLEARGRPRRLGRCRTPRQLRGGAALLHPGSE